MARSKQPRHVVAEAYPEQLQKSYGRLTAPKRHFGREAANRGPFTRVFRELAEVAPAVDDTEVNYDVCFTVIWR